jgi:uncharacterized surface protein with fasciclin (FAS1) repeats
MEDYAPVLTTLSGDGPFTVFAPSDVAFAAAGVDLTDVATVTAVLQYHVVSGSIPSSALEPTQSVATLQGEEVMVTVTDGNVFVNGDAQVVLADGMVANGVVQIIDTVLLPPSLVTTADDESSARGVQGLTGITMLTAVCAIILNSSLKLE